MGCCFACGHRALAATEVDFAADEARSAGVLLHQAFDLFRRGADAAAAAAFAGAVGTGNLNDAGRTLAYWYIFMAEQHLGHEDAAAEALQSFIVVAQDVLLDQDEAAALGDDFTERFDLRRRLARARATLSAVWAGHASKFGRHSSQPVLVHSAIEQDYFLQLAMPCVAQQSRQVVHLPAAQRQPHLEEVRVHCRGAHGATAHYYFQVVGD